MASLQVLALKVAIALRELREQEHRTYGSGIKVVHAGRCGVELENLLEACENIQRAVESPQLNSAKTSDYPT